MHDNARRGLCMCLRVRAGFEGNSRSTSTRRSLGVSAIETGTASTGSGMVTISRLPVWPKTDAFCSSARHIVLVCRSMIAMAWKRPDAFMLVAGRLPRDLLTKSEIPHAAACEKTEGRADGPLPKLLGEKPLEFLE